MSETHVNMFGGSPLNRLSWLRSSHSFLNAIVHDPRTRWILFDAGQPLVLTKKDDRRKLSLALLTTADIKPFLGPEPYFGQGQNAGDLFAEEGGGEHSSHHSPTEGARHLGPPVVFLGLHEDKKADSSSALPSSEFKDPESALERLEGTPYFSLDVAEVGSTPENLQEVLDASSVAKAGEGQLSWSEPRALMSIQDAFAGAVFAQARSLVDWNFRNKFCPGCGSPTYSMWGGWKINCQTLLPWSDNAGKKPCPSAKGLHNFTHPRTDAVVIMIAIDETGEKVLLGRNRRFPGKFYSALAGFIEPGESFEDAVAREMWEEAGVHVWNIKYHSGQPWPYPANLMVGFYARADSTKPIRTDLDNELVDARWFSREEVLEVLNHVNGTYLSRTDQQQASDSIDKRDNTTQKSLAPAEGGTAPPKPTASERRSSVSEQQPAFKIPPLTAIAGVLIRDWAERKIGFPPDKSDSVVHKGSL